MKRQRDDYKNSQLDKFNYIIQYKDWLLNQICKTSYIINDINLYIRHLSYNINKIRRISAPPFKELLDSLYIDDDSNYVFIDNNGIVFQTANFDISKIPIEFIKFTTITYLISCMKNMIYKIWYDYEYGFNKVSVYINLDKSQIITKNLRKYFTSKSNFDLLII